MCVCVDKFWSVDDCSKKKSSAELIDAVEDATSDVPFFTTFKSAGVNASSLILFIKKIFDCQLHLARTFLAFLLLET